MTVVVRPVLGPLPGRVTPPVRSRLWPRRIVYMRLSGCRGLHRWHSGRRVLRGDVGRRGFPSVRGQGGEAVITAAENGGRELLLVVRSTTVRRRHRHLLMLLRTGHHAGTDGCRRPVRRRTGGGGREHAVLLTPTSTLVATRGHPGCVSCKLLWRKNDCGVGPVSRSRDRR